MALVCECYQVQEITLHASLHQDNNLFQEQAQSRRQEKGADLFQNECQL